MFVHNIDSVLVAIPISAERSIPIHWYGVIFVFGILFSYYMFKKLGKKRGLQLSNKDYEDMLMYGTIGVIVGARLGAILSDTSFYVSNPSQIFAVWNGGLAFHGGLIGVILATLLYAKRKKVQFMQLADILVIPVAFGLALGRIANFINGEFYGTPTSLPWGVQFPFIDDVFRHPTQIYESILMFGIFFLLWKIKDKYPAGATFATFLVTYAVGRFMVEMFKASSSVTHIGPLTWGQFWNIPMLIVGLALLYKLRSARKADPHENT